LTLEKRVNGLTAILEKTINNILENDDGTYQNHLNFLSSQYPELKKWESASKMASKSDVNEDVLEVLEIVVKASLDADFLLNQRVKFSASDFLNKVVIKTLKVAQTALATLLFKTPFRVGLAYNALHSVIKYLDREMKKKQKLEKKKK